MTTMTNMRRTTDEDYYTRRRLTTRPRSWRPSPSRSAPNLRSIRFQALLKALKARLWKRQESVKIQIIHLNLRSFVN